MSCGGASAGEPSQIAEHGIYWKAKLILTLLQNRLLLSVNRVFILADKLYELDIGAKHLLKVNEVSFSCGLEENNDKKK